MTALPMMLMTDEEVAGFGRNDGAGFGALRTERGLLPLVAMEVDARVTGVVAATELAQTFVNTTGTAIEATYIFPLPDRAAVHAFRMEVAGRVVDGVVEERGEARAQYDRALAAGHRAAITEEDRAGVFTLRVGNLMPGETATVRLSLVGPLPVDDGELTFRFPLVVAPRYIPGSALGGDQAGLGRAPDTDLVPDASRISPPVLLPGCPNPVRLGLRVALTDHAVRDVASSLHAVTTAQRDAHVVEVHPGERLDRDFILRWRIDPAAGGAGVLRSDLVCADDADGRAGTFMVTFVPPSTTAVAAKPRDVVLVLDRSGSMEGWKMVAARRAAARMIDTLTSRDRFCALAFDDTVEPIPQLGLVEASDRNRFRAVEALARVEARGGTEMADPLWRAVQLLAGGFDDRERVVVLVTDGQVGNEDHILRELAPGLRNVRMCTLGIDQAVNAAFLRRLAGASGGLCELIESEDRLDAVMAKVHRRIGTPIATELALRGAGLTIDDAQTSPRRLPDVYAGAPVTILGRYRGRAGAGAAVDIEGTSLGDPLRLTIARAPSSEPARWLAASWARAAIRDREDRYAAGERVGLERDIVGISKQFGVLSRFTAFLAVDRAQVANPGGEHRQVIQPVEQPAGWGETPELATRAQGSGSVMGVPIGAMSLAGGARPTLAGGGGSMAGQGFASGPHYELAREEDLDDGVNPASFSELSSGAAFEDLEQREVRELLQNELSGSMPALPPPPAQAWAQPSRPAHQPAPFAKRELADASKADAPAVGSAQLAQLERFARELEASAHGAADATAIRVLRQRLTQWIEDVRSVGGHDALVDAVERLVKRLSAALAAAAAGATAAAALAAEVVAVAAELAALAGGAPPPPKNSRLAFWK